jgi:hypothetical protein
VDEPVSGSLRKLLLFAAVAEIATGLVLLADPVILGRLLFAAEVTGIAPVLARAFGVAILALGLAPAFRTMLIYNALIAAYLAYLGAAGQTVGVLLWPAAALHGALALGLFWAGRGSRATHR